MQPYNCNSPVTNKVASILLTWPACDVNSNYRKITSYTLWMGTARVGQLSDEAASLSLMRQWRIDLLMGSLLLVCSQMQFQSAPLRITICLISTYKGTKWRERSSSVQNKTGWFINLIKTINTKQLKGHIPSNKPNAGSSCYIATKKVLLRV